MTNNKVINWFIRGGAIRGRTNLEMVRIFVFTHLAGPLIAQPMAIALYLVSPVVTPQLLIMVLGILSFATLPFILRMTGNLPLATFLSFQGLTGMSLFGTYFYGGFSSPFLPWLIVGLLLGLFYQSKKVPLVLTVFVANLSVFIACITYFGLPNDIPAQDLRLLVWLSIIAATVYMTWMALYYARVMALRTELEIEAERFRNTLQELEHAREVAEKVNRNRSLFLSKMSHELRTPLNAIIGYSDILLEECMDKPTNPQTKQDLSRINAAGKHLLSLVSEVLDPEKIENGIQDVDLVEFTLGQLCDDVVATAYPTITRANNKLVVDCSMRNEILQTDRTKVAQILINLLGNAGKFTQNGTVKLLIRIEKSIADDRLIATVSDTGIGISHTAIPKLFEAYIQADVNISGRFGGTGMGLAITRKFCALLGGEISVTSKLGEGSQFTVDIPAYLSADRGSVVSEALMKRAA